ncbi:MAG: Lrp/AsnC family transcriptional regulator [Ruminococcaceae bacterium]|nr:Lrp/AsnC family transcriptional regulator [Oscillospiraceae bacterium]
MNNKILKLLENNARMSNETISAITGLTEQETRENIENMENEGIIRGYKTIVDWDKIEDSAVSAIIELKVIPKAGLGFEDIASRIAQYPNVESVFLMSGACDLCVIVKCKSFHEVSAFVAKELAVIEGVTSTATQFIMRRYKDFGIELSSADDDGRGNISL